MDKMQYLDVILGQLSLEKGVKSLAKSMKKLRKTQIWTSISVLGLTYLVLDQEKRLTKLEKIRVENLKNEFDKKEKSRDFKDKFDDFDYDFDEDLG